jgi:tetratricopeptide (TPR) repeat protein
LAEKTMKRLTYIIVGIVTCAMLAVVAGWQIRAHQQGMPIGPALPPQPPDRDISKEIIALNEEAVEMHFSDPEAAMRLYDEALERDPEYWVALANKGNLLRNSMKYAEATVCYEKLTELRPRVAEHYVSHARCLHYLGKDGEARRQLLKAISAYNYQMKEDPFYARLNRTGILFLLHRDSLVRSELEDLGKDETEHAAKMVAALRDAMKKAERDGRWSLIE